MDSGRYHKYADDIIYGDPKEYFWNVKKKALV